MELELSNENLRKREAPSPQQRLKSPLKSSSNSISFKNDEEEPDSSNDCQILFHSDAGSEETSKKAYRATYKTQFRALFYKNISLQSQQKGTNICQIFTPIICLLAALLIKDLAQSRIRNIYAFEMDYPYFFNVPYQTLYNHSYSPVQLTDCLQFYLFDFENATKKTKKFVLGDGKKTGLLNKTIPEFGNAQKLYKCPKYDTVMPYFEESQEASTNEHIYQNLLYLNNQTFKPFQDSPGLDVLPDGAVTFYEATHKNLSLKLQINDLRLPEYHRTNGVTKISLKSNKNTKQTLNSRDKIVMRVADGQLILLDLISKAYLQKINPKVFLLSGSQYMPITTSDHSILLKIISIAGSSLYPIALSLLLPVFMYTLVLEKEERLREMMKMNGLKMKNYWFINYMWNLGLYLISSFLFLMFGRFVLNVPFFTETNLSVLLLVLFGWGLSQVSLSFFYQNFLSKSRTATIVGYLLSLWTTIIGITFSTGIYSYPELLPLGLKMYPPFAFCRLIYFLSMRCGGIGCVTKFTHLNEEAIECIYSLYLGAAAFLIIGLYLNAILPQEYGVPEHPLFFLSKCLKRKRNNNVVYHIQPEQLGDQRSERKDSSELFNDMDVSQESDFVKNIQPPYNKYPLIVKNLRKVYKAVGGRPPKVAVKNLSLHIKKGEMFGLLGPNGAGKTSLISMLTGLYKPEAGNAWIGGYSILDEIDQVHTQMGVCPQFDLLWPDLTVEDHLLFYARVRGVFKEEEKKVTEKAMAEVHLTKFAQFKVNQLSGGMKRRLSVAISLVGDPQIVFLDEPTTGLDPENRRRLWDILVEARGNRAIVLTTHSMEEADVLCTRIGIITNGGLRCIGPQTRLKSRYGNGYHLSISCNRDKSFYKLDRNNQKKLEEQNYQTLNEHIKSFLPKAILKSAFNGNFVFLIPFEGLEISKVFKELETRKNEFNISDWGISQCTLEDVFMEVVGDSENK